MAGRGDSAEARAVVYCIVPRALAAKLHEPLRNHFRDDPDLRVIVERRGRERRKPGELRAGAAEPAAGDERRRVRSASGRRIEDRRVQVLAIEPPPLPRRARRYAADLIFVERIEPSGQHAEDVDTARLVTRIQAGDEHAFADLYLRYFDRVYAYLRLALESPHEAEDATQQVFLRVLQALPRYERRTVPFRAWLFVIVRNLALTQLKGAERSVVVDPAEINERRERSAEAEMELPALEWIVDSDLMLFIERLPSTQRQVLMMRFMLDLTAAEIGTILGRSPSDVRRLQSRALRFLQQRLAAIGREPPRGEKIRMRRWAKQAVVLRRRRTALIT